MKKLLLVREILNGLVRLVKAINCKITCCCKSECNTKRNSDESIKNNEITSTSITSV